MDQIKTGLNFVWTHRFWFSLGVVVILSIATYPTGASTLQHRANTTKQKLENTYSNVEKFARGQHPNRKFISVAEEKKEELDQVVESLWEEIYLEQHKLMTWPEEVRGRFAHRPFFADLNEERTVPLINYYRNLFQDQVYEIYYLLDPIEVEEDGHVLGTVEAPLSVLPHAVWEDTPTSKQAWLAQEELWIYRELIRAITNANENAMKLSDSAARWKAASVRRLISIGLGNMALDTQTLMKGEQLINALEGETPQATSPQAMMGGRGPRRAARGRRGTHNIDPVRYIEQNEQYRIVPVSLSMLVDQRRIQQILAELSSTNFNFVITQVSLLMPDKPVEMPRPLLDQAQNRSDEEVEADEASGNDAIFNTMRLDVYGKMRIYEMPPKFKEQFEKAYEQSIYIRELGDPVPGLASGEGAEPAQPNEGEAPAETDQPVEPEPQQADPETPAEPEPAQPTAAEPDAAAPSDAPETDSPSNTEAAPEDGAAEASDVPDEAAPEDE